MYNAIDPQQLMHILNSQQQPGKKEQYPMFFGNKHQISEMVYDYFSAKPLPKPSLGDEIYGLYYSLDFNLAQATTSGVFMDWLSPFYLVTCIHNFADSLINEKTTNEVVLRKQYEEQLNEINQRMGQYIADLEYSIKTAGLEKQLQGPGELEIKAYEMKMKEMDAKIKRYDDIINGVSPFSSGTGQDGYGNISVIGEDSDSSNSNSENGNSILGYLDNLVMDNEINISYGSDILGDVNSEFIYKFQLNVDPLTIHDKSTGISNPSYMPEIGYQ